MAFMMPARYKSVEDLPTPKDARVHLQEVRGRQPGVASGEAPLVQDACNTLRLHWGSAQMLTLLRPCAPIALCRSPSAPTPWCGTRAGSLSPTAGSKRTSSGEAL